MYAAALSSRSIPFELHIYPFGAHGLATADSETNGELPPRIARDHQWIPSALSWLGLTFGK